MKIEKSKILISVVFLLTVLCGLNGYFILINKVVDTISGKNTIDIQDPDANKFNNEAFILDTNTNQQDDAVLNQSFSLFEKLAHFKI